LVEESGLFGGSGSVDGPGLVAESCLVEGSGSNQV